LKNQELEGFFDQISSYHIAMDLLFVNKRYQDVLDVYDVLRNKQLYGTRYPRDCVVLALASCYKLNTPESYNYSINLLKLAREVGANILRKGITFASALALAQCINNKHHYLRSAEVDNLL
ncbi:pentatricopeptide repeat-containing protein 2, mitochondrial-like, partial [Centruroides sculpturatus]|uniref:pentatricopeptide repeat-containing protein 2, mitochondrial-like n=1 Tax=Centruroides sculpturatus TaxID=218467 RepID=UPI000C6EF9BB